MKKSIIMASLAAVLLFGAFSGEKKPQKEQVKQPTQKELNERYLAECKNQLNLYIKDNFRNPDATKLSDMKVVDLSDSLCILNFRFITENGYGGHINGKGQFILLKYECENYISFMHDTQDTPRYCVGSDWLGEVVTELLAWTLPMEYTDTDSLVKKTCVKGKTYDASSHYIQAYCIIKRCGKKAIEEDKNEPSGEIPSTPWSE